MRSRPRAAVLPVMLGLIAVLVSVGSSATASPGERQDVPKPGLIAPGVLWLGQQPAGVDAETILSDVPAGVTRVMWTDSPNIAPVLKSGGDYFRVVDAAPGTGSTEAPQAGDESNQPQDEITPLAPFGCQVTITTPFRTKIFGLFNAKGSVKWSNCFNVREVNAQACLRYEFAFTFGCITKRWTPVTALTIAPSALCGETFLNHTWATWYIATYFAVGGGSLVATNQSPNATLKCGV